MVNRVFRGPTVNLGERVYPCPDLLGEIAQAMKEDQENPDALSADLIQLYESASESDRVIMNQVLVLVCGFSLPTLLKSALADDSLLRAMKIELEPDDDIPDSPP